MKVTVNPTVTVAGQNVPDFKSFSVSTRLGIAETVFSIELDRPIEVTTDDTASIKYNIGGQDYDLVKDKKIEITGKSSYQTSISGEGSLISRYGPYRTIIFINETWLKAMYPDAILQNGMILKPIAGINATGGDLHTKFHGVSINRYFAIQELPGKDTKDHEFECILMPSPSYSTIRQYIARKTGYEIKCNLPEFYIQKTFVISAGEPFFSALNKLYGWWNPMIYIKENTIHIVDVGGDAQTPPKGTGVINITEDSFSVLKYNTNDTGEIVDHLLITGPTSNWTYRGMRTNTINKHRLADVTLPGVTQTLVEEEDYEQELLTSSAEVESALSQEGISLDKTSVYEFADPMGEREGRRLRTVTMKVNIDTGESAITKEVVEQYNVAGTLSHKTETTYKWASYSQPLGHTTKEWSNLGVLEGGVTEADRGGYLFKCPADRSFTLISMEVVEFGQFIGDTGFHEADLYHYQRAQYLLDEDTYNDADIYVKRRPQTVTNNSMIGVTPSTWEEKDDPNSELGWKDSMILSSKESIRYNVTSPYVLRKKRIVESYLPSITRKVYTEDIPLKRGTKTEQVVKKWEFFRVIDMEGNPTIIQINEGDPPPSSFFGNDPGLFHPKMTLTCPDLVDDIYALRLAKRIFAKKIRQNTTATLKFTTPLPGISLGMIINLPTCTKEVFDYNSTGWVTVDITGINMWITGIRTVCNFSGDIDSSGRHMDFYTEIDLKKNF